MSQGSHKTKWSMVTISTAAVFILHCGVAICSYLEFEYPTQFQQLSDLQSSVTVLCQVWTAVLMAAIGLDEYGRHKPPAVRSDNNERPITRTGNSQLHTALQQYQQFTQQATVTLKLHIDSIEYYIAWKGALFQPTVQTNTSTIGIPIELQQCLHIVSNQRCTVTIVSSTTPSNIELQPSSVNDYEIIESNTNDIELNLLSQLNVINILKIDGEYCKFPYYVRNKQLIYLQPVVRENTAVVPSYVRLAQSSEISVVPLTRKKDTVETQKSTELPPSTKLRIQPIDTDTAELLMDRYVYVTQYSLDRLLLKNNSLVLLTYTKYNTTTNESHTYNTVVRAQFSPLVAHNHIILTNTLKIEVRCNCFEHITIQGIHNSIATQYDRLIYSIVLQPLQLTHHNIADSTNNDTLTEDSILSAWNSYLSLSKNTLPVLNESIINLDGYDTPFCISINTRDDPSNTVKSDNKNVSVKTLPVYYLLALNDTRTKRPLIKPIYNTLSHTIEYTDTTEITQQYTIEQLGGIDTTIQQCKQHLDLLLNPILVKQRIQTFKSFHQSMGGICITGATGTGKTALIYAVAQYYRLHSDIYAVPIILNGNTLASINKTSSITTKLKQTFKHAVQHSPALLIIDDIDALIPAPTGEQQNDSNVLRSICIAELLNDLLTDIRTKYAKYPVTVIVTQKSASSTHSTLQLSQLLSLHITLKTPSTEQRTDILYKLFERYNIQLDKKTDMSRIALRCQDGMTCYDLLHIVARSIHNATVRYLQTHQNIQDSVQNDQSQYGDELHIDTDFAHMFNHNKYRQQNAATNKVLIKPIDIDKALAGYTPAHLKQLNLSKQSTAITFNDIGALINVKQTLKDTIELPSKYQQLFNNIPIKLRSGLLLYGGPGTGKTMIATAVANEIHINLISVKGPELLNKYIGASEQAVRDVFQRARLAAPCILLFDEFESIVPKRGGDSTGVTDRVVNQFLCELDGVESRSNNVYILACSSRPDMIDPALLRPGRIDKTLYCPFPNKHDRFEILNTLTRNIELSEDVDLQYIANNTENYSGADLSAIVTTAQINMLHTAIEQHKHSHTSSNNDVQPDITVPVLTQDALLDALEQSVPSLSLKQRKMYESVYDKFVESKQAQPTADEFDPDKKMKTTFA